MSIVAIARPAPLTIQPTLPSNLTKFSPASPASTSVASSSEISLSAAYSGCLNKPFPSKVTFASTAIILSSDVLKSGLISNIEASIPSYALYNEETNFTICLRLKTLKSNSRINQFFEYSFWSVFGDMFDIHASFGRIYNHIFSFISI